MPIDTAAKRRSSMRRYLTPRPAADGVFDLADAQDSLWQYRGNLFSFAKIMRYRAAISEGSKDVARVTSTGSKDIAEVESTEPKNIAKISYA